jgi:hypothetical protein
MPTRRARLLILCKTYPSPSSQYVETSCVAAMEETGQLVRLYPVPFQLMQDEAQFNQPENTLIGWNWMDNWRCEESVVEQSKERYYIALRQTQGTIRTANPDWQPWLVYFLGVLTEQKSRLEKKIARERILLGRLPELSVQILELCRERGHVAISDIAKATGANRLDGPLRRSTKSRRRY